MTPDAVPRSRRILALSSQVAFGHVGLSAAVPVLQRLGHSVTALPTVMLSNHPGWPHVAGRRVPVADLDSMIDALDANGWLAQHDTVLTGYLPSAEHVALAARLIDRLRPRVEGLRVVVDPVLGDTPKGLYIAEPAALALRDDLVPRADVLTPNAFELGWLTGFPVSTLAEVRAAAGKLACLVLTTSAPAGAGQTGVLDLSNGESTVFKAPMLTGVPHGTGDVFAALIAGGWSSACAFAGLGALIEASQGADHLRITEASDTWTRAAATSYQSKRATGQA